MKRLHAILFAALIATLSLAACDKPTFVSLLGLEQAQAYADRVLDQAHDALRQTGLTQLDNLHALADWVGRRAH